MLKEQRLVTHIDCYITGSIDPGLFIIEAKPGEGIPLERVEAMIWQELNLLKKEPIAARELEKIKNKVESTLVFSENNILNKAINLAFFELLGNPEQINTEVELYRQVSAVDIQNVAQSIFTEENCSALHYKASSSAEIRA